MLNVDVRNVAKSWVLSNHLKNLLSVSVLQQQSVKSVVISLKFYLIKDVDLHQSLQELLEHKVQQARQVVMVLSVLMEPQE
jgi:hypothetical protein